jgi:hypothetical protein
MMESNEKNRFAGIPKSKLKIKTVIPGDKVKKLFNCK